MQVEFPQHPFRHRSIFGRLLIIQRVLNELDIARALDIFLLHLVRHLEEMAGKVREFQNEQEALVL